MSYLSLDEQCLQKIEKYTAKIREAFKQIENLTAVEIDKGLAGYALTQCLTNLYETVVRVNSENLTVKLLPILKRTKITRNIASHDYDSINWDIVKDLSRFILKTVTADFLKDCNEICEAEKSEVKDYT